jgi:hypothetical protein
MSKATASDLGERPLEELAGYSTPFALALLYIVLVVPALVANTQTSNTLYGDMVVSHIPLINFFIEHPWNFASFPGYSASLPGYHIVLAWTAKLLGYESIDAGTLAIRSAHATFGCLYGYLMYVFLNRLQEQAGSPQNVWRTAALWVSISPTYYFLLSSIYISTDVPALTIYGLYLFLVMFYPSAVAAITASATTLVYWRQGLAPVIAAPFLAAPSQLGSTLRSPMMLAMIVPGSLLLFYIVKFGGALAPPPALPNGLKTGGIFPHTILHAFAFLGLLFPVYSLIFADLFKSMFRVRYTWWIAAALCVIVGWIWSTVPSTYDHDAGRFASIIWTLSRHGPVWESRSLVVLVLALLGALFSGFLARLMIDRPRIRAIILGMFLYLVAQILLILAFQRYIEPLILMSLGLTAASVMPVPKWRLAIFAIVFGVYSLIGVLRIYGALPSI